MMPRDRRLLALGVVVVAAVAAAAGIGFAALNSDSDDSEAGPAVTQGDADCNQIVNAADALAVLAKAADSETSAACVHLAGDVNCDEKIEPQDAALILEYSALGGFDEPASLECPEPGAVVATPTPTATPTQPGSGPPSGSGAASATNTPGGRTAATPTAPVSTQPVVTPTPAPGAPCAGPGGGPGLPGGSPGSPQAGAYGVQPFLPESYLSDAGDSAIEFALIPGRPNEALIALQSGYIYRVPFNQGFAPQLWGDIHTSVDFGGEEGLLSLAFSPNYQNDCRVYLYYTRGSPQPSVLSRFSASPEGGLNEASEEILITVDQPYANHNGGHIVFGNDGLLYLGYGDGGSGGDPENRAQNMSTLLGKVIRIDVSGGTGYSIPGDNPFADGNGGARDEIYALGFRNPYRFSVDPVTGDIWVGDVGQRDWEEVTKLQKGGNFGWDCYEGPDQYDYTSDKCDGKTLIPPRAYYDHSGGNQAVTGGVIYRGDDMPELYGWYVYADFYSGRIWALNPAAGSGEVQIGDVSINIASFTLAADGEIYLVSYSNGIYKLAR
jgi:glucose/arabinose dehydrogenase